MFISLLTAMAVAAAAPSSNAGSEVWETEQAFDAYTHDHGYTKGFYTWSAPEAVAFEPQAVRIHEKLGTALAADASEKDAPSKLRWRPYAVSTSISGDLAWDLGPWTYEGADKGGWFFTIWQKQADGSWLWVLDTGAGKTDARKLPPVNAVLSIGETSSGNQPPEDAAQVDALEVRYNAALHEGGTEAFMQVLAPLRTGMQVVADDSDPEWTSDSIMQTLKNRPRGLTWTHDGGGVSRAGDFVYSYGHANSTQGVYQGHYVRVWRRTDIGWMLAVDIWQRG